MRFKVLILISSLLWLGVTACNHKPATTSNREAAKNTLPDPCVNSVCKLKVDTYPQEVAVLIPPNADFKSVTLFLHGYSSGKGRDKNLTAIMDDFEVIKSFQESKINRVLIIPFSSGKNKDYQKFINNKAGLRNLIHSIYKVFALKVVVDNIQILAQGGAGQVVQNLIKDQSAENKDLKISQITLLDVTYAQFNPRIFMKWIKSGDNKMTIIYLKNSATEKMALRLWDLFSGQKPGPVGGFNLGEGDYLTLIPEAEIPKGPQAHFELVQKWFGRSL